MPGGLHWVQRSRWCSVLLVAVVLSECILSTSGATEQLSIQTVLARAHSYQLHVVTLRGVIKDMQSSPPISMRSRCRLLYGHATFVLEDDTGSLLVGVFGSCLPQADSLLPKDGDQVVLTAVIHVSSNPGELPVMVWALATDIRLVQDATK